MGLIIHKEMSDSAVNNGKLKLSFVIRCIGGNESKYVFVEPMNLRSTCDAIERLSDEWVPHIYCNFAVPIEQCGCDQFGHNPLKTCFGCLDKAYCNGDHVKFVIDLVMNRKKVDTLMIDSLILPPWVFEQLILSAPSGGGFDRIFYRNLGNVPAENYNFKINMSFLLVRRKHMVYTQSSEIIMARMLIKESDYAIQSALDGIIMKDVINIINDYVIPTAP
jgi:hypothetical protein